MAEFNASDEPELPEGMDLRDGYDSPKPPDDLPEIAEQNRLRFADLLADQVRKWIEDPENDYRFTVTRGLERRHELSGRPANRMNGTITFMLEINGGARDSEGSTVIKSPPLVR
jgi:hypothetical protein